MGADDEVKQYRKLKKIHDSTNQAVEHLQTENKRLTAAIQLLLEEKRQWIESKEKWNQIMQQTMVSSNEASAKVSEEMQTLREENRVLRMRLEAI